MDKRPEEVKRKIAEWIGEKVKAAGCDGAVVGLSGGIDSCVVAALAKIALGDKLVGIIMPCESKNEDMEHAVMFAKKFGIRTEQVDLGKVYRSLLGVLPGGNKLSAANLKPRLRMLTLYYFANLNNYIVLGTGNKTELMVGYFTKYGDGGVDLLPIGNLYKKDVRSLAAHLGIQEEIIKKPPSAGLWDGQTDEGEIGMSYDELDSILASIESGVKSAAETKKVERIKILTRKSEHKRKLPEICMV